MTYTEFRDIDTPSNASPKCLVVLCLDVSTSMTGAKIEALNNGVNTMLSYLKSDKTALQVVEIAVVTFESKARVHLPPTSVSEVDSVNMEVAGATALGAGLSESLKVLEDRKKFYKKTKQNYYRPFLILITDGEPTDGDEFKKYATEIYELEQNKGLTFFAFATEGANEEVMRQVSLTRPPQPVSYKDFDKLFKWLSASITIKSKSVDDNKPVVLLPIGEWQGDWNKI